MATLKDGLFLVRVCTKCDESLPLTDEYFYWRKDRGRFETRCLDCRRKAGRDYRENNKETIKEYKKEYYENNKENNKEQRKEHRNGHASFKVFAEQLTVDESPKDDGNGYMLALCTYCGKYFHPTINAVKNRIDSLLGRVGGEKRLYCSDGCKEACPIFYQKLWPKGYKKATSREVDPLIRQLCLKRDEYTCQKCERTIDKIELHAHHIEGAVQQPMIANDVENTITLCIDCHQWVHTQDGCTYYDLRCS